MFTGIIEEMGTLQTIKKGAKSSILSIQGQVIFSNLHVGDSIAVNGVCLTVTDFSKNIFTADVMHETLDRSSLGALQMGNPVNLERALAADGRFGGHIVSGHIDGTGEITAIKRDDNALWYTIKTTEKILHYIIEKGSVAIDGISLTVAKVTAHNFSVSVIPHTIKVTTLNQKTVGDSVNLENDIIGKYVEKLLFHDQPKKTEGNLTKEFLTKFGY